VGLETGGKLWDCFRRKGSLKTISLKPSWQFHFCFYFAVELEEQTAKMKENKYIL